MGARNQALSSVRVANTLKNESFNQASEFFLSMKTLYS